MACPYFYPKERSFTIGWAFAHRLPLGAGFCGTCRAGTEESVPDEATLRNLCNLGHAGNCAKMPEGRKADSLRFAVSRDEGSTISLNYVFDRAHAPAEHGQIAYDIARCSWTSTLADACAQRQAECYLQIYLERRGRRSAG